MTLQGDGFTVPAEVQPDPERAARMELAASVVMEALSAARPTIAVSPLGPAWSSDLDVYVADLSHARQLAETSGWIDLTPVTSALGHLGRSEHAIVCEGRVLAMAGLRSGHAPEPIDKVRRRAERIGGPDVRSVLELRELAAQGIDVGRAGPELLAEAARMERDFGGSVLQRWDTEEPSPARVPAIRIRLFRRPHVRVAVTGVDGVGKSTLVDGLVDAFERCGIPTTVIWTRPGMGLDHLDVLASIARRVLGQNDLGIKRLAEGAETASISSRRGIVGWLWLWVVSIAFVTTVRSQTRSAKGVVIYDRHLVDALATIEVLYRGVESRLHGRFVGALMPKVDITVWLAVDPAIATARKPGDLIGEDLVADQHRCYLRLAPKLDRMVRFDSGELAADQLVLEALAVVSQRLGRRRARPRAMFMRLARRLLHR